MCRAARGGVATREAGLFADENCSCPRGSGFSVLRTALGRVRVSVCALGFAIFMCCGCDVIP